MKTTLPTAADIRRHLMTKPDVLSVRVCRNGHVAALTDAPRGDGGKTPWLRFEGFRDELAREIMTQRDLTA